MPPERLAGPFPASAADIDAINRVFSDAFTDRYQRDGMNGVRVPELNPAVWRYAIETAEDGALIWRDPEGAMVAFNVVHRSGPEGWMGPLAVRPARQGEGIGALIVRTGVERLRAAGARVIGLETMPRTVDNIGFYSRLGFRPEHLTVSMTREPGRGRNGGLPLLSEARERRIAECRELVHTLLPDFDFTREINLTLEAGLGDASLVLEDGAPAAFALWHSAPLALGRSADELRVLKLAARSPEAFGKLLDGLDAAARKVRAERIVIRCQTAYRDAYAALIGAGYRVHWTDLRMTLEGCRELAAQGGGVVFSNWEI
jgi:putative acetyltransferase